MKSEETREVVAAILAEARRTGDLPGAFQARFAPDMVLHLPNGEQGDFALFQAFMKETAGSLPDVTLTAEHSMVDGDRAAFQFMLEGTHVGTFRGFEPTGRRFALPVCWMVRFAEGRVVELWYYASIYDFLIPAYLGQPAGRYEASG